MPNPNVPPRKELDLRMQLFREVLDHRKVDAALIVDERNVRYLSGFTGHDSALLVTRRKQFLLTDFRFIQEAAETAKGFEVIVEPHGIMEKAGLWAKKCRVKTLGIEPGAMRLTDLKPLRAAASGIAIKQAHSMVGELRLFKSEWEVGKIEEALRIQERCYVEFCKVLEVGISERDAAAQLRFMMSKAGADDQAFDTLFQFGPNSALPHARPTYRTLKTDDVVLLDFGAKVAGYHSDLTRSFFVGKIPLKLRQIHEIVHGAQAAVIDKIAPGMELPELDRIAHRFVDEAGYKKFFGHSTGHGIGLNIHEQPSLSMRVKGFLYEGMVVTVEPGIYLPGLGGVRLEDVVLVTNDGHRVLSRLPKGLRWDGGNE